MKYVGKRVASVTIALICLSAVAACAKSTGSGSSGSQATDSAAHSEIVIGNIGAYSGPNAANLAQSEVVLKDFISQANAAGGINGHKIKLIVMDTGTNEAEALPDINQLVQRDRVVAIVGESDQDSGTWEKQIEHSGVPVIGGIPLDAPFLTNPDFFSSGGNGAALFYGMQQVNKSQQNGKMGILYCAESPICAEAVTFSKAIQPVSGVDLASTQSVSASAPDYTQQCLALKAAGVGGYGTELGGPTELKVAADCVQQGVTAKPIVIDGMVDQTWLNDASVNGTTIIGLTFPFFDTSLPATKAYQAFRQRAGLSAASDDANDSYMYAAATLFEAAVKGVGSSAVTSASLKASLYAMKNQTLGGLIPPVSYTKGEPSSAGCYFVYGIANEKFSEPNGLKSYCMPAGAMPGILQKLG